MNLRLLDRCEGDKAVGRMFSKRALAMIAISLRLVTETRSLIQAAALALILFMGTIAPSAAQSACNTISFAASTQWTLCWELRLREGLVIHRADYRDKGGVSRRVLYRGSIAEVHVPYHSGSPRFLDVTLSTAGLGANALDLDPSECHGVLLSRKVCREIRDRGYAWKFSSLFQKGQEVTYWISSQLGQYNYIISWTFRDDGSIRPEAGLTGRLQIVRGGSAYAPFGGRVNPQAASPPTFGINHMHNIYWRLDLDIAGASNDAVNRITQALHTGTSPEPGVNCGIVRTCHINLHTVLAVETIERLAPFKTWHQIDKGTLNVDGRPVGYEIIPEGNQLWTGPSSEPWAAGELYVTSYNGCELFAVNNNNPGLNPGCGSAAPHVQAMVNAQPINGSDIVLWYNAHFLHHVRDEDQVNMLIDHMGLDLQPRNWRHVNTLQ
jgi:primary-amine oxidase